MARKKILLAAALAAAIILLSFAILFAYLLAPVVSGPGNYVVTPGNGVPPAGVTPVDAPVVSYWSLPLWVQVASIIDGILILIGIVTGLPFIISKIQNVLENRNRLMIFNYVADNPGCTQAEITSLRQMKNGTVKYHVQMLQLEGKIILRRMGKFTRIFRNTQGNEVEKVVISYMKNETSRNLLRAIVDQPGVTNRALSDQFMLDKSSVHWHIERFLKDHIVQFEQEGKYKKYYVSPAAVDMIRHSI